MTDEQTLLPIVVRGPTWVSVDTPNPIPGSTGVCVMQIFFQGSPNVRLVKFKNYYVHNVTVKCRSTDDPVTTVCRCGADIAPYVPWKISVYRKVLTQDPDFEDGCQDYVFIHASESATDWSNLSAMLLILRQPSSAWKIFGIKELEVYGHSNGGGPLPMSVVADQECDEAEKSCTKHENDCKYQERHEGDLRENADADVDLGKETELDAAIENQLQELRMLFNTIESFVL